MTRFAAQSNRFTSAKAQKSVVHVIQGDPTEAARAAKETDILKAEENERKRNEAGENRAQAHQDQGRQALCEQARKRYYSVKYRQARVAACGK